MRHKNDYLFINCGLIGTGGKGGHSHNDKLALVMTIKGREIFVDPGIYVYTAGRYFRNRYRSVHSHNTLSLAGAEQNRFSEKSPWWGCHEDTRCECLAWEINDQRDFFAGRHSGFLRFAGGAAHKRTIRWNKTRNEILVEDTLEGSQTIPDCVIGFNLHPDCVITGYAPTAIEFKRDDINLKIESQNGCWTTEPFYYSPEYGLKIYAQRLALNLPANSRVNLLKIRY